MDNRDSSRNGIIVGLSTGVIAYFALQLLNRVVPLVLPQMEYGFSQELLCLVAILLIVIPVQLFHRQNRGLALRGAITASFILGAVWIFYFKSSIFGF